MKKNLLKSMLLACVMGLGTSAWAQTSTLVDLPSDPETGWTEEDATWDKHDSDVQPYTHDELMARIEEGEAQFERGEYKTHEQLMAELKEEFSWLK